MSTPAPSKILIACIGNIFLGDDAFGVEVARRMTGRPLPEGVRLIDFGIRGLDLTFALLDDTYDVVILVDAAPRGQPPGTLYVIEPDLPAACLPDGTPSLPLETHALDPARVLQVATALGSRVRRVLLVGCEPTPLDSESEEVLDLSAPVAAAVDEAVRLVYSLIDRVRSEPLETAAAGAAND